MTDLNFSLPDSSEPDNETNREGGLPTDIAKMFNFVINSLKVQVKALEEINNSIFMNKCENGDVQGVKALLDNPNNQIQTWEKEFGFSLACQEGKLDVVKLLLQREGEPPYSFDIMEGINIAKNGETDESKEVYSFLMDKIFQAVQLSGFIQKCESGDVQGIKTLLDNSSIEIKEIEKKVGFEMACREGKLDVVKLLLQRERELSYSFDLVEGAEIAQLGESDKSKEVYSFLMEKIKKDAQPVKQKALIPLYRLSSTLNENPPKGEIEIGGHNLRKGPRNK